MLQPIESFYSDKWKALTERTRTGAIGAERWERDRPAGYYVEYGRDGGYVLAHGEDTGVWHRFYAETDAEALDYANALLTDNPAKARRR